MMYTSRSAASAPFSQNYLLQLLLPGTPEPLTSGVTSSVSGMCEDTPCAHYK